MHSVIEANIYCLKTEEGGRKNPFVSGYRPQLYFRTADTAVEIALPDGVKIAMPGDNLTIKAKLNFPLAIYQGARFALREGGKTIAAGVITKILPENTVLDFGKPKKVKAEVKHPDPKAPAATAAGGKKPAAGDKKADPKAASAPKPAAGGKPAEGAKPAAGKPAATSAPKPGANSPPKPAATGAKPTPTSGAKPATPAPGAKPATGAPGAKPATGAPAAKPTPPGVKPTAPGVKPAASPAKPAATGAPGAKPAAGTPPKPTPPGTKPAATGAKPASPAKPADPKKKWYRLIGQIFLFWVNVYRSDDGPVVLASSDSLELIPMDNELMDNRLQKSACDG